MGKLTDALKKAAEEFAKKSSEEKTSEGGSE